MNGEGAMPWVDPGGLVANNQFANAVYDSYEPPDEEEEALLEQGINPWQMDEDGNARETLDCASVQRFLVWCAHKNQSFLLRYYSPSRDASINVEARVYFSVRVYPNIHSRGGSILADLDNPFVFTHRNNDNVWCLVAYIKDRDEDNGMNYRWITAREYNSGENDRRYPRVKGINNSTGFINNSVQGVGAQRDCLPMAFIDEQAMEEPPVQPDNQGFEDESDDEPEPEPRRVTRSMAAAAVRFNAGPALSTRSRSQTQSSLSQGGGALFSRSGGSSSRGRGRGGRAEGRGEGRGRGRGGRAEGRGRGTNNTSQRRSLVTTTTRRFTRSLASNPAQNTRSRRGGRL